MFAHFLRFQATEFASSRQVSINHTHTHTHTRTHTHTHTHTRARARKAEHVKSKLLCGCDGTKVVVSWCLEPSQPLGVTSGLNLISSSHLSLHHKGHLGTTDDFATSFLHFPQFSTALGLDELHASPFPDVVFPPLPLSALSSSPFHCALQDGFGQT